MNSIGSQPKKPPTKQFIYNLYKTYEAAYGDIPNAKTKSLHKVQKATNLSRGTVYKILKEVRDQPKTFGSSRKWATGISDENVQEIRNKIISLSALNNGHVPLRKIYAELKKVELFHGGRATLHTLLQQMGFFYRHTRDGWKLISKEEETPINEQLNHNQNQFANFSTSNMMEVKHSPATQMEFRSTTNGLPDEEDEDLDTLFDEGDGKSLTPPSDDDGTKAPILNGINKHPEVLSPAEILDGMEIDLIKDEVDSNDKTIEADSADSKKENEEAEEASRADLDMFEVDLDEESAKSTENGEITDTSKVRDTGDDLDTLLSKINDLVEDCMEPKTEGAHTAAAREDSADDVVEIPDDDAYDIITNVPTVGDNAEIKPVNKAEGSVTEDKAEAETKVETKSDTAKVTEKVSAAFVSKTPRTEKMDIDDNLVDVCDDIVCLDSPLPEEANNDEDESMTEEQLRDISSSNEVEKGEQTKEKEVPQTDKEPAKEEEIINKTNEPTGKPVSKEPKPIEDDEIFLIEDDDDDDEPMKEAPSPAKSEEKLKESVEEQKEREKELEKEIEKELEEMIKPEEEEEKEQNKSKVAAENKPLINNDEDDDDDIVCLDDSIEEIEVKDDEAKEDSSKKVEDGEKKEKDSEKVSEEVSEKVEETITGNADKDKENTEKEPKKVLVEEVLENVVVEEVVEKVVEKVEEKVLEEVVEKLVEKIQEQVVEEISKEVDVPDEAKSESNDTPIDDKKVSTEPEKSSNAIVGDDIVILDDDDEDEVTEKRDEKSSTTDSDKKSLEEDKKIEEKSSSSEEVTTAKPSTILSDNSDNARDGVEEKEDNAEVKASEEKTPIPSESNSRSNSSNLLKVTAVEEREENSEQPPAKRIRLSQDEASSRQSTVSQEDTKSNTVDEDEVMEVVARGDEDSKSLKRVHSTESVSSDFKKPKTEQESVKVVEVEPKPESVVKKPVDVKPLALYPPPKLEPPTIDLSLDFLRRFKKSVHKMTKSDLEELVLQKIVEAIVHKSEFSEMRDLIEKQEKIISGHRTKITELNKQFRDLEMVHNRVLKDLETKNSQFIMPVKITRAVGLQVFFPNKKSDQPMVPPSSMQTPPTPISRSMTSLGSTPDRSSVANSPATSSNAVKSTTPNSNSATVVNNAQQQAAVQRRGCVQKLTPMRPDTPRNSPLNRILAQSAVSSTTPSPVAAKDAAPNVKILNRTLAQKTRLNVPSLTGNVIVASTPPPVVVQPVAKPNTMLAPPGIASKKATVVKCTDQRSKVLPKNCQSDPQIIAQPLPAAATVVQPQIPPSSTTNAIVTAKPPSKSVIDLTDEDDVVPTPVANSPRTPAPSPAAATPVTPVARTTPSPSANSTMTRGPYKVSVIPQQQLQQPRPNPPKQTPPRPVGKIPIAPKPNGVAVPVRQIPANVSRYRHPAPLPNQPVHNSNPAWKLPPARPTIRISNLESGIVISWTIEDTAKDKYAESTSYQIYAYQETSGPPLVESWRHVGDVKAMLLPMAVTLTQFQEGQRYYFAVRAVDAHNRCGPFSFAKTWS